MVRWVSGQLPPRKIVHWLGLGFGLGLGLGLGLERSFPWGNCPGTGMVIFHYWETN